jgi:gliding motility-associated lipoprotein GldH
MRIILIFFISCSFLFVACDDQRIVEKNVDFKNKIWLSDSLVTLPFEITDTQKNYNIYFNLRNTVSYPYENIYITYYLKDTANVELEKNLVNYNLFDTKSGKPFGSGLGDVFDHQFLLLENFEFSKPGLYVLQVQQYMRMDSLTEVVSAGTRVEQVTN